MARWSGTRDQVDAELLGNVTILRALSAVARERLVKDVCCRTYGKGAQIQLEEDARGPLVHGVVSGSVQIEFQSYEGRQLSVRELGAGQLFALNDLTAVAMDEVVAHILSSPTVLCEMPQAALDREIITCQDAAKALIDDQRKWIETLSGLGSDRLHKDPKTRIRRTLLRETAARGQATIFCTYD